jgi:hypothetical protein
MAVHRLLIGLLIMSTLVACGQTVPISTQDQIPTQDKTTGPSSTVTQPYSFATFSSTFLPTKAPTSTGTVTPTSTTVPTATPPSIDSGPFQYVTSLAGVPIESPALPVQVRALEDGSVWVITFEWAARWNRETWDFIYPLEEGVQADVDALGRLWLLKQDADGIDVWQDGQWTTYGIESGWTKAYQSASDWWAPKPWRVSIAADGTIWLPTQDDVRQYDGQHWIVHTMEQMGFPAPEYDDSIAHQITLLDGGREVWVGECFYSGPGPMGGQGVRWFDGTTWRGEDVPVGQACVSFTGVDTAGNVWLGAKDVLWQYKWADDTWMAYYLPESFLSGYNFTHPRDLIVDNLGDIWVILQYCGGGSCDAISRLHRIHGGMWSQVLETQDWFMPPKILALDHVGQGWLFWDETVIRLEGSSLEPVIELAVRGVDIAPDGKMWIVVVGYETDATLWVLKPVDGE